MIFKESFVLVGDNTGAITVRCIHVYGGFWKKFATVGDYLLIAVQHRRRKKQFIVNNLYLCVLVTQVKKFHRLAGYYISFVYNKILLLSDQKKFIGTRIYGPIAKELLYSKLTRVLSVVKRLC